MTKKGLSVVVACGLLLALAGHVWAQGQQDTGLEGLPPDLLRDVAGIHQNLNRLVDLLEGIEGNQRMDLLIKRIGLKERRLEPLVGRLADEQSRLRNLEQEIEQLQTMRADLARRVDELRQAGIETGQDDETMSGEIDAMIESLTSQIEQSRTNILQLEDELAEERKDITVLDDLLLEALDR